MPSEFLLDRSWVAYKSDDGNTYQIATTNFNILANGATAEAPGAHPEVPKRWRVRHVYGLSSGGIRAKIPILDPANAVYVGSGHTFTKNSVSFTVQGIIGETRTKRV
jgi:hypothetical protein